MKKLLFILIVLFSVSSFGQPISPTGPKWKFTPNQVGDSMNVRNYFKLQGETFKLTSPTDDQAIIRDGGVWKNMTISNVAYDSVNFNTSTGLLRFYKTGSVVMSGYLNGRYALISSLTDSLAYMRVELSDSTTAVRSALNDSIEAVRSALNDSIAAVRSAINDSIAAVRGDFVTSAEVDALQNVFSIILPSSGTVAGRCVTPTEVPSGWNVAADGVSPTSLVVTHSLGRHITYVSVFTISGATERQLFGNAAYAGIYAQTTSILKIESLATIASAIRINLIFK